MTKQITIEVSDETYEFLESKTDETETVETVAVEYLLEGINLEKTLRL
jgi:hypothetical protein